MTEARDPAGRQEALVRGFVTRFGRRPEVLVRAPGRVNLIGEHTDYNGLPVLPMAIDRSILIAAAGRDDSEVEIANAAERFPPRRYRLEADLRPFGPGDWGNYHQAAARILLDAGERQGLRGGAFLVAGDIPSGAGLSSSSALVVGSALALLALNGRTMAPIELAERAAAAERSVGTESGGMDQAVCLLAKAGHALRIDFDPLRARPVAIPAGYDVVVCDSLVEAAKSGAARAAYNGRVIECRLACCAFECLLGASLPRPLARLGELVRLFPERAPADFVALIENALPARPLALGELAERLGLSPTRLVGAAGAALAPDALFSVVRRARHVLTEAARVEEAVAALEAGDWLALSALMDASHASCRDDYEISSPALEALLTAAKNAGAIGARLTGAGFGGCTINLVASEDTALFVKMMARTVYHGRPATHRREHCFPVLASGGATVAPVEGAT